MNAPLKILHLEDSRADADLARLLLESEGIVCDIVRVETRQAFQAALDQGHFDLILSDYSLPSFDGISALAVARAVSPDTPFIFLSGVLGEDTAVKTLQNGATDYVLKHRLARLPSAIRRALQERSDRIERKRMETELRESHSRLQAILENSPSMIFLKDLDGRYLVSNREFTKITHRSPEETIGRTDAELFPPEQAEAFRANDRKVLEAGVPLKFEEVALHDDGLHTSIVSKFPLRDASGEIYAVGGIVTDITDRRKMEQALRATNETLSALVHSSPMAITVLDLDGNVSLWNPAAERIFGWRADEVLGRPLPTIPADKAEEHRAFRERVMTQGGFTNIEVLRQKKGGAPIHISLSTAPLRDAEGRISGIIGIMADITERKQLEQQFLRAQRMESLGTLAGGIAHDLNNVLSPIMMAIRLLEMNLPDQQNRQYLTAIENSAKRGAHMVKQILSFARGSDGQRVSVHIRSLIAEAEQIARDTFPRSIQVLTSVPNDAWNIVADSTQLYQVLLNLCVNARDAMPNGGTLKLTVTNAVLDDHYARMHPGAKPGPYVVFSVADTGTGIPPDVLERIFDPFFTTKEVGKGTGLGLSTVLGIAKSHGGFINVYSEVGKGTEFKVYLPAEGATQSSLVAKPQSLPLGHGELILVVDDEATVRDMAKMTLEAHGYRVLTGADGTEALALYAPRQTEIAAVVTDMMMPFMDGPATIRALRKLNPAVKVIAVSGLATNEKAAEVAAGDAAVTFLHKPYTAEAFLTTLNDVIKGIR